MNTHSTGTSTTNLDTAFASSSSPGGVASPSPVVSPPIMSTGAPHPATFVSLLDTIGLDNVGDAAIARQIGEYMSAISGSSSSSSYGDMFKALSSAVRAVETPEGSRGRRALYRAMGRICDKGESERKRFGEAGVCETLARRLEALVTDSATDPEELTELLDAVRYLARDSDNAVRFYDQGVLAFTVTALHCHALFDHTDLWCAGVRTLRNVACDIEEAVRELVIVLEGAAVALEALHFGAEHRGLVHAGLLLMDSVLDVDDQAAVLWEGAGVEAILIATSRFITDADVVSNALGNLTRLAKHNDEYREVMPERGVCELGMSAIAHCYRDKEVVDSAVELMLLLGKDASPAVKKLELEALGEDLARLKASLSKYDDDDGQHAKSIDEDEVLGSLAPITYYWVNSSDDKADVSERLLHAGQLSDLVIRAITTCPRNAAVQGAAAELLVWLLEKDRKLGAKLGEAGLCERLVTALDEHRQTRQTQKALAMAVMSLGARDDGNRERIKEAWAARKRRSSGGKRGGSSSSTNNSSS